MSNVFRTVEFSEGLVEFLLNGLGSDSQACLQHCTDTLLAIGSEVIPDLQHAAENTRMTLRHQRRVAATKEALAESDGSSANPIVGMFRALLALVAYEWDDNLVIRAVAMVANITGRHIVANVLSDELCDHYRDQRYATRLIRALASISDALSTVHREYLHQIIRFASNEVAWRCEQLVKWIDDRDQNVVLLNDGFRDDVCKGLRLLDWLTRAAVVGSDTAVQDPEWLWLRDYRYRPMIVNHGPILTVQSSKVDVQFAACGPA